MKTILLLGSGELGKEVAIAAQRLGQTVVACDKYAGAPAMQVADAAEVFDMLDGDALAAAVAKHRPDIIVPEIEGIEIEVPDANHIVIKGMDKQKVGQFAADTRMKRPPEPYKGKGIRYQGEVVRIKEGKTGAK